MIYKASYIINGVLSCIFLMLVLFVIIRVEKKFDATAVIALIFLLGTYSLFLWLDFICAKVFKHNKEQILISEKIKKQGKIVRIITTILAILIVLLTFIAAISFYGYATKEIYRQWPFIIFYLVMWLLSGVTAIINVFYLNKAIKENKTLIDNTISVIGS